MKNTMKKKNGFTLVELIVVLVVLGILTAVSVPALLGVIDKGQEKKCLAVRGSIISDYLSDRAIEQSKLEESKSNTIKFDAGKGEEEYFNSSYIPQCGKNCPQGGDYTGHIVDGKAYITCDKHTTESDRVLLPAFTGLTDEDDENQGGGEGTGGGETTKLSPTPEPTEAPEPTTSAPSPVVPSVTPEGTPVVTPSITPEVSPVVTPEGTPIPEPTPTPTEEYRKVEITNKLNTQPSSITLDVALTLDEVIRRKNNGAAKLQLNGFTIIAGLNLKKEVVYYVTNSDSLQLDLEVDINTMEDLTVTNGGKALVPLTPTMPTQIWTSDLLPDSKKDWNPQIEQYALYIDENNNIYMYMKDDKSPNLPPSDGSYKSGDAWYRLRTSSDWEK